MNHQELVTAIARRLPDRSRREVAEVLAVMTDICIEQLSRPGQVVQIADLGRLSIDVHQLQAAGAVEPKTLTRIVGRFRPALRLRQAIELTIEEESH